MPTPQIARALGFRVERRTQRDDAKDLGIMVNHPPCSVSPKLHSNIQGKKGLKLLTFSGANNAILTVIQPP
jgi:hypothetical protein